MKNKQLFWGILFITIGFIVLLNNIFDIYFDWDLVWKFWPLVFVLWGIALLIKDAAVKIIIVAATAVLLGIAIFASFQSLFGLIKYHDDIEVNFDDYDEESEEVQNYSEPYDSTVQNASLTFKGGAGSIYMKTPTDNLFYALNDGLKNKFLLHTTKNEDKTELEFSMKSRKFSFGSGRIKNRTEISLNTNPVWELDFDLGAAAVNLDLSPYKVEKLSIDLGAASLKLKLGSLIDKSEITIDAGASSIEIEIPEDAGCEVKTDVALSSRTFENFTKIGKDLYRTADFDNAKKKIYLDVESGLSSITVHRSSW